MPRGQPDFGMYQPKTVGATLADMADLAVRLGSVVEFDRRGDVIALDDFEAPVLKWRIATLPAGGTGVLSNYSPKGGAGCLLLTSPGSDDGWVRAFKGIQFLGSYHLGVEWSFSLPDSVSDFYIDIDVFTGSRRVKGAIRFHYDNQTLEYLDSDNAWQSLATGVKVGSMQFLYYTLKLVVDASTEKYVRAIFGNTEYDLSSYAARATDSTVAPEVIFDIYLTAHEAVAKTTYFDNFVATMNEP